jgi:cation diffusion facilitator family transporter
MSFPSPPRNRHELSLRRPSLTGYTIVGGAGADSEVAFITRPALGPPSPATLAPAAAADADAEAADAAPAADADDDVEAPLLSPPVAHDDHTDDTDGHLRRRLEAAYAVSWVVNTVLLAAKAWAYAASGSKAVLASAADSAVDLASQFVISWADQKARRPDPRFPVGAARLEIVGVVVCACLMSAAAYAVVAQSVSDLYLGFARGLPPVVEMFPSLFAVLAGATLLKAGCYAQCAALRGSSDAMVALAEDHLNDIVSNLAAIGTALAAQLPWSAAWGGGGGGEGGTRLWPADPVGAILISVWILARWLAIFRDAVDKLCGANADDETYAALERLAREHDPLMQLDVLRCYRFGPRFLCEVEVTMPPDTILRVSHDRALTLQHKIEALDEVERAFVHVDYQRRHDLEHKAERALFGDRAGQEEALRQTRSGSLGGGGGAGASSGGGGGG